MEPFKQQRDLLRRNGVAGVAHGDHRLLPPTGQPQIQRGVLRRILGGVFQQIVDHLRDKLVVPPHHNGVLGDVRLHVQPPLVDLLLHAQQRNTHALAQVKVLLVHLLRLDLGNIQHPPHQPAEPVALVGDDLQIFPLVLLGDGPVQNAVGIAGNGGHRRFQLVGDIGDKVPPLPLRFRKRIGHHVK